MRIFAAAALLLLASLVVAVAAAATSNTSDTWERERSEEETRRIFTKWKAEHGTTDSSLAEEDEECAYAKFKHRLRDIDRRWHDDGYSVLPWEMGRSEEDMRQLFVERKVGAGITYSSIAEEEQRYAIFKNLLRAIDRHNARYAIGVHCNRQASPWRCPRPFVAGLRPRLPMVPREIENYIYG